MKNVVRKQMNNKLKKGKASKDKSMSDLANEPTKSSEYNACE